MRAAIFVTQKCLAIIRIANAMATMVAIEWKPKTKQKNEIIFLKKKNI